MTDWFDDRNCADKPQDLFFDDAREAEALLVCQWCPVKEPCRQAVMAAEVRQAAGEVTVYAYGVAGGMTAADREAFYDSVLAEAA